MQRLGLSVAVVGALCFGGCVEPAAPMSDSGLDATDPNSSTPDAGAVDAPVVSSTQSLTLDGTLSGRGQFKLFDVGSATVGDEWSVVWGGAPYAAKPFIVTLFDQNHELLSRAIVSAGGELRHVIRADLERAYIGISPANGSTGGNFSFDARRRSGLPVPEARPQIVWLNFGSGHDVRVHGRPGISFDAFEGEMLGAAYAGETTLIRDEIVAQMRRDYATFNVVFFTSYEGPPPAEPHTVMHFGGDDVSLLGLADNVDLYNAEPAQAAIIYMNAFASYGTMKLEPAEFAVMIANVASHELGHLLGLYHTSNPDDVMDTTGSAWDLAGEQWFGSVELEASVFPTGFENSPARLAETLGLRPDAALGVEPDGDEPPGTPTASLKPQIRALLREYTNRELHHACGNCIDLDGCGAPHE